MKYLVVSRFDDNEAKHRYEKGDAFPHPNFELPSDERIAVLLGDNAYKRPFIEEVVEEAEVVEETTESEEVETEEETVETEEEVEVVEEETPKTTRSKKGK